MSRLTEDVDGVRWFFSNSIVHIGSNAFRFAGGICLLFFLEWRLAGAVLILLYWCFLIVSPFISIVVWAIIISVAVYPAHVSLAAKVGGRQKLSATIIVLIGLASLKIR